MKITVLGSGSGMADPERSSSAYHVAASSGDYLLDAGENAARQCLKYRLDPLRLRAVFISHSHADHMSGLFMLLQWMHLQDRKETLEIHVPSGIQPVFDSVLSVFHIYEERWAFRLHIQPILGGLVWNEGFTVKAIPNGHLKNNHASAEARGIGCDAYSFLFYEDPARPVIFTSDVPSLDHLQIHILPGTWLISECTHFPAGEIGSFAARNGIERVYITHLSGNLSDPIGFSIPCEPVSDGQVITR